MEVFQRTGRGPYECSSDAGAFGVVGGVPGGDGPVFGPPVGACPGSLAERAQRQELEDRVQHVEFLA